MACTFSTSGRQLDVQKWPEDGVLCTFSLPNVLRATAGCTFSTSTSKSHPNPTCFDTFYFQMRFAPAACTFFTSQLPKVLRTRRALYMLISKCASHHNGVHFFDILTSKSGPNIVCIVNVHFQMCFVPQRRAIFHLLSAQLAPHPPL